MKTRFKLYWALEKAVLLYIKHKLTTVERCLISNATSLFVTSKVNYQSASLYSILIEER